MHSFFQASNDLSSGTVANAWHFIAEEMASTAETHKTMAALMTEDLVKPLRAFADAQHKSRKTIEGNARNLFIFDNFYFFQHMY